MKLDLNLLGVFIFVWLGLSPPLCISDPIWTCLSQACLCSSLSPSVLAHGSPWPGTFCLGPASLGLSLGLFRDLTLAGVAEGLMPSLTHASRGHTCGPVCGVCPHTSLCPQCSRSCGGGSSVRDVQCVDTRDLRPLRPFHCQPGPAKPRTHRPCGAQPCLSWAPSRGSARSLGHVLCERLAALQPRGLSPLFSWPSPLQETIPQMRVGFEYRVGSRHGTRPSQEALKVGLGARSGQSGTGHRDGFPVEVSLPLMLRWPRETLLPPHSPQCSAPCGGGVQRRLVKCVNTQTGLPEEDSDQCGHEAWPESSRPCGIEDCKPIQLPRESLNPWLSAKSPGSAPLLVLRSLLYLLLDSPHSGSERPLPCLDTLPLTGVAFLPQIPLPQGPEAVPPPCPACHQHAPSQHLRALLCAA
ncbi:hypothetical protein P7K49_013074 [Saguinus oedipus]|uniref:Uncharacterized protein n=1 Tax=Saguinus oedipus TaxID=9490 RepID=A0ABQ9VEV5_SAGOE|nr:hypothetical protein P7K49_013074 [Saguinus oedipus]